MPPIIYHNPNCGTSRNVLALLQERGLNPKVVLYLKNPPSRDEIKALVQRMGVPLRGILREKGTPYEELGLGNPALDDEALLDAIAAHPILINRPIVVTDKGAKLCRPKELVLDLL